MRYQGQRVPHEDCGRYCQCNDEVVVVRSCEAFFFFDFESQVCVRSQYADCRTARDAEITVYEQKATARCLEVNAEGWKMPHRYCDQYYECTNRVAVRQDCPDGWNFDRDRRMCDWAYNVYCDDRWRCRAD